MIRGSSVKTLAVRPLSSLFRNVSVIGVLLNKFLMYNWNASPLSGRSTARDMFALSHDFRRSISVL